jgi:hypothetical protein
VVIVEVMSTFYSAYLASTPNLCPRWQTCIMRYVYVKNTKQQFIRSDDLSSVPLRSDHVTFHVPNSKEYVFCFGLFLRK